MHLRRGYAALQLAKSDHNGAKRKHNEKEKRLSNVRAP